MKNTEMLPANRETITAIVERYQAAMEAIEDLHTVHTEADKIFRSFDNTGWYMRLDNECDYEKSQKRLTRNAWRQIIKKTGLLEAMTEKRKAEIERTVENDRMPEITVENCLDILKQLYDRTPDLLREFVADCYNMFIPTQYSGLRTNSGGEIGKRGIISYVFNCDYCFSLSYNRGYTRLKTLENTFSLLDGKGIVTNDKENLASKVRLAIKEGKKELETEYFRLKWYKNDRLHVEFKRLDLLRELNRIGAGNRLKAA